MWGHCGGSFGSKNVLQGHGEGSGLKGERNRQAMVEEWLSLCVSFLWLL